MFEGEVEGSKNWKQILCVLLLNLLRFTHVQICNRVHACLLLPFIYLENAIGGGYDDVHAASVLRPLT